MNVKSKRYLSAVALELLHMQMVEYVVFESNLTIDKSYSTLENLGFRFGQRVTARLGRGQIRLEDNLDVIKFICKEVWMEMFNKHVDKLETDHKGTYLIHDHKFKFLMRISDQTLEKTLEKAKFYLIYTSGMIRGALSALGVESFVTAKISTLPGCMFKIEERR